MLEVSQEANILNWPLDETELICEIQRGSRAAFDSLVTNCHAEIYSMLFLMLRDRNQAGDVTQTVFLKASRRIGTFRQRGPLKTWFYRLAVREAQRQRSSHRPRHFAADVNRREVSAAMQIAPAASSQSSKPESPTEPQQEEHQALQQALGRVPEALRTVLILRDHAGLSHEEIAAVLNLSRGDVQTRIIRGRRVLHKLLKAVLVQRTAESPV